MIYVIQVKCGIGCWQDDVLPGTAHEYTDQREAYKALQRRRKNSSHEVFKIITRTKG